MANLQNKRILLGLTGSIACYKSAYLCRELIKAGADVQVVMTTAAQQFITPLTMQSLSKHQVYTTQFPTKEQQLGMPHIDLTRNIDAILVAPASADFVAQIATGMAHELLGLLCLAKLPDTPLLLAPAMNKQMWQHPANQRNLVQLVADGVNLLGVGQGEQACGEFGDGRMLEPDQIVQLLQGIFAPKVLVGKNVLITAGPTFEKIDAVRGITNLSSGKMGFALAKAAQQAGAQVRLIAGPVSLNTPVAVRRIDIVSAQQMQQAVQNNQDWADIFISVAAVADWTPKQSYTHKVKKVPEQNQYNIELVKTNDILASVAQSERARTGKLFCVGFAAESENLIEFAQQKRSQKGIPLLVANSCSKAFASDQNEVFLLTDSGVEKLSLASKSDIANKIIQQIAKMVS